MMKHTMKSVAAIALAAATMVSVSACGSSNSSESGDKTLSILVEGGGPAEKVARQTAAEFEKQSGYKIKIDTSPYSGLYDKLKAETDSSKATHDLAVIDVLWFPALAKGLSPVDGVLSKSDEADLMPKLKDGATVNGKMMGVPTWTNSKVMLYRKDLFDNPQNQQEFKQKYGYDLKVPTNWEQYRDAAKFFTKDGMYGTALIGQTGADSVTGWLEFATQAGAKNLVIGKDGKSDLQDKAYAKALDYMQSLVKDGSIPSDYLSLGTSEISNMFNQGKIAMELTWGHFYLASAKALGNDKVGAAPMIGGSAGIGAIPGPWYQVVMKNSKKQDAAKKYLKFMYSHNEGYMKALGVAARKSVFKKYENNPQYEHVKALETTLAAPQTQNRPATKMWTQIETENLSPMVQSVLKGANSESELGKTQKAVDSLLAE
ncbi:sugar ABC transporter substrate-binding protein [Bifidobacterium sp. ESL0775]|uniref:ABC transporter substrate-binding protein n=1 Tax=Bifidobacterium sp. ESL0775 TaxID=2983230 RepID=UPI0023F7723E|nr:sugar ABC transporter substrate-binding protein [Bifidobacterium sp. ESL0775]WEV69075.1 sugar ABC transporter substrate-binding protein [Bifidobacterium sp. ESL0775]